MSLRRSVTTPGNGSSSGPRVTTDAQENALVLAVTGDAGCGKSQAIEYYARHHRDVFALSCSEYWNRKQFLTELLQAMGVEATGSTVAEMMSEAILTLKRKATPIVVLDEADKLSDQVLYFFISLYNKLEDHCGIIICATDYLKKRITRRGHRGGLRGERNYGPRDDRRDHRRQRVRPAPGQAACACREKTAFKQ